MPNYSSLNPNRTKYRADGPTPESWVATANQLINNRQYIEALDVLEQLSDLVPDANEGVLALAYEVYQMMGVSDRYSLYQRRHFDFNIPNGAKVLDIGSGSLPFPYATHLAEFAPEDDAYGRAGVAFSNPKGLPVTQCSIESMPFDNHEFDFVYCAHVLEHVHSPEKACSELMRVARRGYLETPTRGKDLWLNTAKVSNHIWTVEYIHNQLQFTQYYPEELEGLRTSLLMNMHCSPQTAREKAFSALVLLKSAQINTMLLWEDRFDFSVRRH